MRAELQKALSHRLGERAAFERPLAPLTTWKLGGPAWCLCTVQDAEEAAFVLRAAGRAGLACKVLGKGSNLLVHDRGYDGVMLRLAGTLARVTSHGQEIVAGGGASLAACVKLAASQGLAGLEWAAGIPASLGGAVATNAGAMGSDMAMAVKKMTLLLPGGESREYDNEDIKASYRSRCLPRGSLVLEATLAMRPSEPELVQERTKAVLGKRQQGQPLAAHTAGSVFKNPPGDYAGRLIEAAGCKGLSKGDAVVSERHANFIENRGSATASQVLALMEEVSRRVRESFGVELEPEVEVVGDV